MLERCFSRALLLLFLMACIGLTYVDGPVRAETETPAASYSLPIRITQQPAPSESDRASAKASEQREIANLEAQQRMVRESRKMVWVSIAQLVLAIAGTAALLFTVQANQRALKEASRANDTNFQILAHERKRSHTELKGYVGITDIGVNVDQLYSGFIQRNFHQQFITIKFKNYGQTPGKDVRVFAHACLGPPGNHLQDSDFDNVASDMAEFRRGDRGACSKFYQCAGQELETRVFLGEVHGSSELKDFSLAEIVQRMRPYIYGRIYYRDYDRKAWRLNFCYVYEPRLQLFIPYEHYNTELADDHIEDRVSVRAGSEFQPN